MKPRSPHNSKADSDYKGYDIKPNGDVHYNGTHAQSMGTPEEAKKWVDKNLKNMERGDKRREAASQKLRERSPGTSENWLKRG